MKMLRGIVPAVILALAAAACGSPAAPVGQSTHKATAPATVKPTPKPPATSPAKPKPKSTDKVNCSQKISSSYPVLRQVRFGANKGYDRLVFHFCKPANVKIEVLRIPHEGGVPLKGADWFIIRITPAASLYKGTVPTIKDAIDAPAGRNVQQYLPLPDGPGIAAYGVGLAHYHGYTEGGYVDSKDSRHVLKYVDFPL